MAGTSTKRVSKPTNGSTRNNGRSAPIPKPDLAENKAAEVENNAESQVPANVESSQPGCTPAKAPKGLSTEVREFVATNLPQILQGLMKGIEQGNASGARLLLDYCRTADAEADQKGLKAAEGVRLHDLFGDDMDWDRLHQLLKHRANETPHAEVETGIDAGSGGVEIACLEPQLTLARGA